MKTAVLYLIVFLFLPLCSLRADENRALERLMNLVSALQEIGDEMLGDPVTGTVSLGDTTVFQLTFSQEYMYHIHIMSDSYFNVMEFWLTDSRGESRNSAGGDHASIAAYPDTTGEWTLSIILHEESSSDSASFAAAVFKSKRYL